MKKYLLLFAGLLLVTTLFAQKGTKNRSSETGRYVNKNYTSKNPKTTVTERGGNKNNTVKYRSAETGQYTNKSHSNKNPKTTLVEQPRKRYSK